MNHNIKVACRQCGSNHWCSCRVGPVDRHGHARSGASTPNEAAAQGEQRRLDRAELDARTDNDEL